MGGEHKESRIPWPQAGKLARPRALSLFSPESVTIARMILTCPECATRYQTDAALFTPDGRKVRCAKCGHVWYQAAPAAESDVEFVHSEEPSEDPAAEEAIVPQRSAFAPSHTVDGTEARVRPPTRWLERLGLVVGWIGLAAIVVVIGWSALTYRQQIASLWPQSSSLYAAMGLKVNTLGIEFRDWQKRYETEDGQDVLVLTGHFVNITSHELSVPQIRVSLYDDGKRELYHWVFSPGVATLRPGQVASFLTRLSSPPASARHVEARFVERGN
jgi:predicted Zn finger-like uncharacterized protein